ncbi:uncharacterized protein LOC117648096 [Thrips palmi]|uniref:Uncharacterized protein LOC117648096 n=1 Tax=Thrips palmi TaxID=161013 RepID=A0A6P8ZCB8_THRPL|nr:uncharacterized protein LOC117648096 [Thrips palmi]
MWSLTVLLVASLVGSAPGEEQSLQASAAAVEKVGQALPGVLLKQWADLSPVMKASFEAAVKREAAAYTEAASKKAVDDAIALLRKLTATRFDSDGSFKNAEAAAVAGLVANYTSLINERLKPGSKDAGDEDAILALRKVKQTLFVKLESRYLSMNAGTRATFRRAFQTISSQVAKNATVRKNVRESAGRMLLHLVNNQKKLISVLTGHFRLVEKFATDADNVLFRIAVPAQTKAL